MTRPWSLRGRLVRRVVLGACAAWLAGVVLAATVISHEMSELMDDSLEASARLSLALYRGAGQLGPLPPGDSAIRIVDGDMAVTDAPWAPVTDDGGQDLPGWRVFRLADPDSDLVVEVGHTNAWRRDELRESLAWLVALMLPVLLAAPVAIRGAVGSALRPATRFADGLRGRSAQDLSPVAAPDLPAELTPIPQALNSYLDTIRDDLLLQLSRADARASGAGRSGPSCSGSGRASAGCPAARSARPPAPAGSCCRASGDRRAPGSDGRRWRVRCDTRPRLTPRAGSARCESCARPSRRSAAPRTVGPLRADRSPQNVRQERRTVADGRVFGRRGPGDAGADMQGAAPPILNRVIASAPISVRLGGATTRSFIRSTTIVPPARNAPNCPAGPIGATCPTASSGDKGR
ncbi:sensor histidine kinase family protein [Paracoccus rhizosphaerae]|uniref:histidine kinase n=1 Tax=Paracoccus rhizosphaerae TaxID=1133347 RepID=A0ABV6CQZ2_9RHOB|nr:hypothetical protein [Paracoccus rhizosphaerae]